MMDHSTLAPIGATVSSMGVDGEAVMTSFCRKSRYVNLTKMLVCLLVIVSLLLSMVVPVHAIALTTGIAIATVGALVLAACGVVLTAPTGQSLTDYIGGQIDSYAVSQGYSNRSTWLNDVTQQTVTSTSIWSILDNAVKIPGGIYNALATWAGSYVEDNNITSSGNPVGELGSSVYYTTYPSAYSYNYSNGNFVFPVSSRYGGSVIGVYIPVSSIPAGTSVDINYPTNNGRTMWYTTSTGNYSSWDYSLQIFCTNNTGRQTSSGLYIASVSSGHITVPPSQYSNYQYIFIGNTEYFHTGNTYVAITAPYTFSVSNIATSTPAGAVVTPTATVVEPLDAALGQDVIIRGLPVSSSMTPEEAADAIQDQATTSAGLTATPSLDGEAVPEGSGWLYNAIQAVGEFIVDGIGGLFIPSEGFWDVYVDNISDLFDDRMGLLTYPISVVADLFGRVADLEDAAPILRWNDVVWKNQVVIPGGSYNLNDILEEDSMETIYGIYRVVVSGIMVIALIHLFIKKLEEIETK